MNINRDMCWLLDSHKPFIGSFEIKGSSSSPILNAVRREIPLLFSIEKGGKPLLLSLHADAPKKDGYLIEDKDDRFSIESATEAGLLYGLFGLRRAIVTGTPLPLMAVPDQSIRMLNHWDNFDGTIERGYAGASIYYDHNRFRNDTQITWEYARMLASVGINAVSVNNVNVHREETFFITEKYLPEIKKIADIFREYGIKTFLSVNFAAPILVGGLDNADPLDEKTSAFWTDACKNIYHIIPDFGGFVVKADSEGEPGPFTYGRNHDDGANMLARAIQPYGGIIIWRCFVYNCAQDWRDRSVDRAKAAYDIFAPLDGKFDENVTLQIKNGPIDFQIREPVSPLFGALKKTNHILEFQITQEYTGHQIDICYLAPMWKEVLEFDTAHGKNSLVREALADRSPVPSLSGIAAVVGVGMDRNWMGNKLAQANLYAFGRLVWDNTLSPKDIAAEWISQTFLIEKTDHAKILDILLTSRQTYENYTCPLSVGFMCTTINHYGVSVDGYEYDRWGTYHYADREGIGRDRTKATGTGYTMQYADARAEEYEDLGKIPDELLLFFHHVPYSHTLHSGKTVIQHIYDSHFDGSAAIDGYIADWESLKGRMNKESYENVRNRLDLQRANAIAWRDEVNSYFYRKSGIPDELGRTIYP